MTKIKINLLHIISGDLWAGAESQVYNTLCALNTDEKINVACVLFNNGILKNKLDSIGVPIKVIDESKLNTLRILIKLNEIVKKQNPDIIHVHHTKEHFLGYLSTVLYKKKVQLIRTMHGLHAVRSGLTLYRLLRSSVVVGLDKILVKYFTNALIAVSIDLRSHLKYTMVKKYLIYNSLDVDQYLCCRNEQSKIVDKYRPNGKKVFWIGATARLVRPKNIEMLIDAGELLKKNKIPFQISIFGDGPLKSTLKERIVRQNLEREIILHGFVDGIIDIIKALDVTVLCSIHEGLPMALLETMVLETPVICTNVGGMKEIIENEISGLIVGSNDVVGLANALLSLHNNMELRNKIVKNAKQTVLERFSTKNTTRELVTVYEKMKK